MSEEYSIRDGKGVRWRMVNKNCMGVSEVSGFTIDNLDTKELDAAVSPYESVFIEIRKQTEKHSSLCMDVESERLSLCQAIADQLRKKGLIRKTN